MKDIESRLGETPARSPRRKLGNDFTAQTMQQIKERGRISLGKRLLSRLPGASYGVKPMHKLSKTTALAGSLAIIAITAGTAFAAVQWLQPHVQIDPQKTITLPNGNKRVLVKVDTCQGQDMKGPWEQYIEIKANAQITPQDIANYRQAECEADLLPQLFADAAPTVDKTSAQNFKPGQEQYVFPYGTVKSVGQDFIVVDVGLNGQDFHNVRVPVDKDARFYLKGKPIKLSDLQPGKEVTLVIHTTALQQPYSTETLRPDEIHKLSKDGLPIGATLKGAIEHVHSQSDVYKALQSSGVQWTSLEKDSHSPDGWRQVTPLK
jgi:hypothetical protein